jgi:hypothetical protein
MHGTLVPVRPLHNPGTRPRKESRDHRSSVRPPGRRLLPAVFRGSIGGYWDAGGRVGGQRTRCPRRCSTIVPARTRAPQRSKIPAATQESEEAPFFPIVPTTRPMPPPRRMTAVAYHKLRTNLGQGRRPWVALSSTSGTAFNCPTCSGQNSQRRGRSRYPRGRTCNCGLRPSCFHYHYAEDRDLADRRATAIQMKEPSNRIRNQALEPPDMRRPARAHAHQPDRLVQGCGWLQRRVGRCLAPSWRAARMTATEGRRTLAVRATA